MAIKIKNGVSKICSKCRIDKKLADFTIIKCNGVLKAECKVCANDRKIKWRKNNREKQIYIQNKQYYNNRDVILERVKKRAENIKGQLKIYNAAYRNINKDAVNEQKKIYIAKNKAAYDKRQRDYRRNRLQWDINYKILARLRNRVHTAIKINKNNRKERKTIELLGCTVIEFKEYFSLLFTDGMTWELFMLGEIHIDHIKPCIKFNLLDEEEQRKCFHYTNLQPLWKMDNLIKGSFYEEKIA